MRPGSGGLRFEVSIFNLNHIQELKELVQASNPHADMVQVYRGPAADHRCGRCDLA